MQVRLDGRELDRLAVDLTTAPLKAIAALGPVAHRAGAQIKSGIRRNASGHSRLPGLARAVSYDVSMSGTSVTVDVGFDKSGQGNLANIAVYGTSDTAPFVDIDAPLAAEVPKFMAWVVKAGTDAL